MRLSAFILLLTACAGFGLPPQASQLFSAPEPEPSGATWLASNDVPGAVIWFDASYEDSLGSVSKIVGAFSTNYTASEATTSRWPTVVDNDDGFRAIRFDGGDDKLDIRGPGGALDYYASSPTGTFYFAFSRTNSSDYSVAIGGGSYFPAYWHINGNLYWLQSSYAIWSGIGTATGNHILVATRSNSTYRAWLDGIYLGQVSGGNTDGNWTYFGRASSAYHDGDIYFAGWCTNIHSDATISNNMSTVTGKAGWE